MQAAEGTWFFNEPFRPNTQARPTLKKNVNEKTNQKYECIDDAEFGDGKSFVQEETKKKDKSAYQ